GEFIDFIAAFKRKHPKIRVNLAIANQLLDLVSQNVDVAIRFGALQDSGVVARRLGVGHRGLVAAPAYLRRRGAPRGAQDLPEHDCILFPGKSELGEWQLRSGRKRVRVRVTGAAAANNFETVNELALRALGIAFVPENYARAGVSDGSLQRVLPSWTSEPIPV